MKLSDKGSALIESFEGFRSCPYRDPVGVWTIGFGSTRGVGPNTPCVTRAQARTRLKREVDEIYGAAVNALRLPLNQNQYDALCSFVYNLGPGAIGDTGIGRALRRHEWRVAADEMLRWDKAGGKVLPGLTRRRKAERALFLTPVENPLRVLGPINRFRAERLLWHRRRRASGAKNQDKYIRSYKAKLEHEIRKLRGSDGIAPKPGTNKRKQYDVLHRVVNDRDGHI